MEPIQHEELASRIRGFRKRKDVEYSTLSRYFVLFWICARWLQVRLFVDDWVYPVFAFGNIRCWVPNQAAELRREHL